MVDLDCARKKLKEADQDGDNMEFLKFLKNYMKTTLPF